MKVRKILIILALLIVFIVASILTLEMLLSKVSSSGKDFIFDGNQKNKYFLVVRKEVDYLTPATVLALRSTTDVTKIPEYFPSLCIDYEWMNPKRFIYIFATEKDADKFDTYGYENIKTNKPIGKYVAKYSMDFITVEFYPLIREKRYTVSLPHDWCKH